MLVMLSGIDTLVSFKIERATSDAGDGQAVDGGWDGYRAAGAGVAGDGDRPLLVV